MIAVVVVLLAVVLVVALIAWNTSQPRGQDEKRGDPDSARRWRANGIQFLLGELARSEKWAGLSGTEKTRIVELYKSELAELQGQHGTATWEVRRTAPAPGAAASPPHVPTPPKPRDWSWLAEQQANVFLFAGAFLIVIAALIYVGYSG